jgi:hypothetical protein
LTLTSRDFSPQLASFCHRRSSTLVSVGGGIQARWLHDGQELVYLAPDNRLMSVKIRLDFEIGRADPGTPVALFAPHLSGNPRQMGARHYMVSRDGKFLINTLKEVTLPVTVILNWKPDR